MSIQLGRFSLLSLQRFILFMALLTQMIFSLVISVNLFFVCSSRYFFFFFIIYYQWIFFLIQVFWKPELSFLIMLWPLTSILWSSNSNSNKQNSMIMLTVDKIQIFGSIPHVHIWGTILFLFFQFLYIVIWDFC